MTKSVVLNDDGFWIDGVRRRIIAAQFDYFRHDKMYWETILQSISDAGITIVSTFIAWDFHEVTPGQFDLTGATHPSRDLQGFLDLCAQHDLLVFARPGPNIDAEWETRGPAPDVMKLDRLHPRFLQRTREWFRAVCEVLVPAQHTNGGPVAAICLDNEILMPWATSEELHQIDGDVIRPYDEELYDRNFADWLKDRYSSIDGVNGTLGTDFADFGAVRGPRFGEDHPAYSHVGLEFLNSAVARYVAQLREILRDLGVGVPVYTNQWALAAHVDWTRVDVDSVGMNLFLPDRMPGHQALVANWWCRVHAARFSFRWAAEMQSGWIGLFRDFGFLSAHHTEYVPMAAQATGIRGLNFFVFAEREDWAHAPVNARGKRRPERFERVKRVARSFNAIADDDDQLADVGLIWTMSDQEARVISTASDWCGVFDETDDLEQPRENRTWWSTFAELVDADVDFRLWIPGVSPGEPPAVLVHAGLPSCPDGDLAALAAALVNGSTLVEVTPVPTHDLAGRQTSQRERCLQEVRATARSVSATIADLRPIVIQLGARSYARASVRGIWTHVSRDRDGRTVLGIWNPTASPFRGQVAISDLALPQGSEELVVAEPRIGDETKLSRAEVRALYVAMEPHSARVLQIRTV